MAKHPRTVPIRDEKRKALIAALAMMPDEAFTYFVLACPESAMLHGGLTQIWPDGMGGFQDESRKSVEAVREAAKVYLGLNDAPTAKVKRQRVRKPKVVTVSVSPEAQEKS